MLCALVNTHVASAVVALAEGTPADRTLVCCRRNALVQYVVCMVYKVFVYAMGVV